MELYEAKQRIAELERQLKLTQKDRDRASGRSASYAVTISQLKEQCAIVAAERNQHALNAAEMMRQRDELKTAVTRLLRNDGGDGSVCYDARVTLDTRREILRQVSTREALK